MTPQGSTEPLRPTSPGGTRTGVPERVSMEIRHRALSLADELAELEADFDQTPRRISSKYFYDERGSILFDQICELPEYYPTRAEHEILERCADEIIGVSHAEEILELGSGMSTKTRVLLDAMQRAGRAHKYLPFEVSEPILRRVSEEIAAEYEGIEVHAVAGDFTTTLEFIPPGGRRLVILIGGTIGNFHPDDAAALLTELCGHMRGGDHFLLGTDLIKDVATLERAYNDAAGVTAAFNLNILQVMNDRFDADFDTSHYRHRAFYDTTNRWIEMRLTSTREQRVAFGKLGKGYTIGAGEEIRTEISAKYDRASATALLVRSGFQPVSFHVDTATRFGISLCMKPGTT